MGCFGDRRFWKVGLDTSIFVKSNSKPSILRRSLIENCGMEPLDDDLAQPQIFFSDYAGDFTSSPHTAHHPGPATSRGNQPQDTSDDALQEHSLAFHSLLEERCFKMSNKKFIGKYFFLFFILLITIFQLDCSLCSVITFWQNF